MSPRTVRWSLACQLTGDRPEALDVRPAQAEVRDADRVSHVNDVIADIPQRADAAVRVVPHHLGVALSLLRQLDDRLLAVVAESAVEEHRKLDLTEARARGISHQTDLPAHRAEC